MRARDRTAHTRRRGRGIRNGAKGKKPREENCVPSFPGQSFSQCGFDRLQHPSGGAGVGRCRMPLSRACGPSINVCSKAISTEMLGLCCSCKHCGILFPVDFKVRGPPPPLCCPHPPPPPGAPPLPALHVKPVHAGCVAYACVGTLVCERGDTTKPCRPSPACALHMCPQLMQLMQPGAPGMIRVSCAPWSPCQKGAQQVHGPFLCTGLRMIG